MSGTMSLFNGYFIALLNQKAIFWPNNKKVCYQMSFIQLKNSVSTLLKRMSVEKRMKTFFSSNPNHHFRQRNFSQEFFFSMQSLNLILFGKFAKRWLTLPSHLGLRTPAKIVWWKLTKFFWQLMNFSFYIEVTI